MGSNLRIHAINGYRCGRWSLFLDAAYCLILGSSVTLFCSDIAGPLALPVSFIAVTGIAVVVWAGSIIWMLRRFPLSRVLRWVMIANVLAAIAVGCVSVIAATLFLKATVLTVAIDIALFAASQGIALRALSGPRDD
ncbi:MAG: hypothetical protein Q4C87_02720 [Actinomycetaceae bacterium]|nr:hypothetical protein [Actinomycetaceae bacterium]